MGTEYRWASKKESAREAPYTIQQYHQWDNMNGLFRIIASSYKHCCIKKAKL